MATGRPPCPFRQQSTYAMESITRLLRAETARLAGGIHGATVIRNLGFYELRRGNGRAGNSQTAAESPVSSGNAGRDTQI